MTERWSGAIVARTGTIRDGLTALDRGAAGIALAVDEDGRLVGIATDGDLRRALLRGAALDDLLEVALNHEFLAVPAGRGRADALDLMRAHRINAVPVVDATGRPVGLHLLHAFLAPVERENWAVIMAGGEGTRLRPLTDAMPKPMLGVAGRPILERIVLHLLGFGIRRFFISVNYLADVIEAHFGDGSSLGVSIEYLREDEPLGTGGALGLLPERPDHDDARAQRGPRDLDRHRRACSRSTPPAGMPRPSARASTCTRCRSAASGATATGSSRSRRSRRSRAR